MAAELDEYLQKSSIQKIKQSCHTDNLFWHDIDRRVSNFFLRTVLKLRVNNKILELRLTKCIVAMLHKHPGAQMLNHRKVNSICVL